MNYLLKMPDNKYLCFNHSIIAVAEGIPLEIEDMQGHWGVCCEWCKHGVPNFHGDPINLKIGPHLKTVK
jgi:hypothetical protein